jgi:hypothetical protein
MSQADLVILVHTEPLPLSTRGKKIHEFAIEYVKERCNVRAAISSKSDAAYALLVDDHIVL